MAIIGQSQPRNQRDLSVQGQRPPGLNVIFSSDPRLNAQRVARAQQKKSVGEYNAAVDQYNKEVAAYQKAVQEQKTQAAQEALEIQDFNRRAATGKLSFSEFQSTKFGQDLVAKYGPKAGKELQQATFYDYVLSFQNPDYKSLGVGNRKDLEYSRAQSYSDAVRQIKFEEKQRQAQQPGFREQQQARAVLTELSRKPALGSADVTRLNTAYDKLNLPRPDYSGTITRRDGTKEVYKGGLLLSVSQGQGFNPNNPRVAQKAQGRIPVIQSPSQLPQGYTGTVVINNPKLKGPVQVTYRQGQVARTQPYIRPWFFQEIYEHN